MKIDRKKCTGRYEVRKEEQRNETHQHRKKGWRVNVNRTEERKFDIELATELAELRKKRHNSVGNTKEMQLRIVYKPVL